MPIKTYRCDGVIDLGIDRTFDSEADFGRRAFHFRCPKCRQRPVLVTRTLHYGVQVICRSIVREMIYEPLCS